MTNASDIRTPDATVTLAPGTPSDLVSGMAAGTSILTLDGAIPVEFLTEGDRVITRDGVRQLRAITAEVIHVRPCRISASALGHDRPEQDLTVAPDQPILLRDWRAKAMFGRATVLVPARRLVDGQHIQQAERASDLRVYHLAFDTPQTVYANGSELATTRVAAPAAI